MKPIHEFKSTVNESYSIHVNQKPNFANAQSLSIWTSKTAAELNNAVINIILRITRDSKET